MKTLDKMLIIPALAATLGVLPCKAIEAENPYTEISTNNTQNITQYNKELSLPAKIGYGILLGASGLTILAIVGILGGACNSLGGGRIDSFIN